MIELLRKYKDIIIIIVLLLIGTMWYGTKESRKQSTILELNEAQVVTTEDKNPVKEENLVIEEKSPESLIEEDKETQSSKPTSPQKIPIYICGEVIDPGVYYVDETAIIDDIINLSGGFTPDANKNYLNLAGPVIAHQKIYVPKQGEEIDKSLNSYDNINIGLVEQSETIQEEKSSSLININLANATELQTLSGIGAVKAQAIIDYRNRNGEFKTLDDLLNVSGIGAKTLEKIKSSITI